MTLDRYRLIFGHRPFLIFWLGFSISVLGDGMGRTALTWFVYESTGSPQAVGWLMLCYTGPVIVGGLLAGPFLDRFDRRTVMVVDNLVRGAVMALIPLLYSAGALALWEIYVAAAVYGLLMMLSLAGGPSLVPSLVPDKLLSTANALEMLSFTIGGVVGPPLAGVLIPLIGAPNVVIFDVVSFVGFALALSRVHLAIEPTRVSPTPIPRENDSTRAGRPEERKLRRRSFSPLASGSWLLNTPLGPPIRLLVGNHVLLTITLMFMAFNVGNGIVMVWLPILVDRTLGGGSGLYGALLGLLSAGEVTSALLAGSITLPLSLGTLICLAQLLSGTVLLILLPVRTVWGAAIALAFFGVFSAPLTIWAQTLRMRIIPPHLRGRTFALLRTMMQGGTPFGGAAAGLLLPALGIPTMIALSAVVVGLPGLAGLRIKALRWAGKVGSPPSSQPVLP